MRRGNQIGLALDSSAIRRMGPTRVVISGILPPPRRIEITTRTKAEARLLFRSLEAYVDVADVPATIEGLDQALQVLSEGHLQRLSDP